MMPLGASLLQTLSSVGLIEPQTLSMKTCQRSLLNPWCHAACARLHLAAMSSYKCCLSTSQLFRVTVKAFNLQCLSPGY